MHTLSDSLFDLSIHFTFLLFIIFGFQHFLLLFTFLDVSRQQPCALPLRSRVPRTTSSPPQVLSPTTCSSQRLVSSSIRSPYPSNGCVNSQDLRNFPSGSIGGWVGSLHLSRMLSRFLSSCVFSLAQVFSKVHQIFGVCGNAHQVQGSSAETPALVDVVPWAFLIMRAQFHKTAQIGVDLAHSSTQ